MSKRIHVVPNKSKDVWQVKAENADRSLINASTKQEAVEIGKNIAKNSKAELVIHKMDGTIQNSNSYGNDPFPPKDTK